MNRTPLPRPDPCAVALALVVEPDHDTRELYAALLDDLVEEIVYAADGPEALAIAIGRRPALVITETRVPRVDGFALCKFLRNDPITADAWLVVVTADARPEVMAQAKSAGAHAAFSKPASSDALLSTIRGLIASGAESQRALERRPRPEPPLSIDVTSPPPAIYCPTCRKVLLRHQRTYVGGVKKDRERWEYYACPSCEGRFAFRHRTGTLQRQ